jgi:hypothetical protein
MCCAPLAWAGVAMDTTTNPHNPPNTAAIAVIANIVFIFKLCPLRRCILLYKTNMYHLS